MTKPYIIAELSGNHNGDINRAFAIMKAAKDAGADAIKIQTYTADTMTIDHDGPDFLINGGLWDGYKLYDLYKEAHTPWEWHADLFNYAKQIGITIFSTPFDETAVDFLESLGAPLYKIASFELVHYPLIEYVAKLKKPMIMSTGMASLEEITEAVNIALNHGCTDLTLLHCVSEYPAPIAHSNLATMLDLKNRFPMCKVGLSDHTLGTTVSIAAAALGAAVIEKHFTLKRAEGGVDSAFSLEPEELKQLCTSSRDAALAIGLINYDRSGSERKNMIFRRSIYAVKDISAGDTFTKDNIKIIRPGYGISPKNFNKILGKRARSTIKMGESFSFREINEE
ncbi:MAG: pseudaminic acid synthase [Gammaproteobacteria bacterium]